MEKAQASRRIRNDSTHSLPQFFLMDIHDFIHTYICIMGCTYNYYSGHRLASFNLIIQLIINFYCFV